MAKGRGNFGFNIGGGGGGIANLVQAPKVTPVRSVQFAPTPQRRVQRDEKDPKKQILGALLGTAAPFAADAALKGLGSISGLDFFEDDPTAASARVSDRVAPAPLDPGKGLTPDELRDRVRQQRLAEISGALPQMAAERKTRLGNIASSLLQFAPAFALAGDEDDGSAGAFISAANAARKLDAATERAEIDAAIRRSQSRASEFAKVDPKLTAVTVNGWKDIDGKLVGYQTRALRDENGVTWIESRGDNRFDKQQGTNEVVPKGQYYRNTQMTMLDGDIAEVTTETFQDSGGETDGQLYEVSLVKTRDPETGQPKLERRGLQDDGTYKTVAQMKQDGKNLVSKVDLTTERAVPGRLKTNAQNKLDNYVLRRNGTRNLVALATQIFDRLGMAGASVDENGDLVRDEDGNIVGLDESITTGSTEYAANLTDVLDRNVRLFGSKMAQLYGMEGADETSVFDEFINRNVDPDAGAGAVQLSGTLGAYQAALESADPTDIRNTRSLLIDDLLTIKNSTTSKDADSKTSWLNLDRKALDEYLQDTGFYGAAQIRLAFLMATARGESLSRISDRDVALNLQTMGFEDGAPSVVVDKLGGAIFDAIRNVDREFASSSTLRKIDLLEGMSPTEQTRTLENIRDDFAARYNLDTGPDSDLDRLYNSEDPAEIARLRRKIRGDAQRNVGGAGTNTFIYDPKLQMFLPATVAREILKGEDPEFGKFGRYLDMLKYNLRTGQTPGKRSTAPARSRNRTTTTTPGGTQTSGAFSQRVQNQTAPSGSGP